MLFIDREADCSSAEAVALVSDALAIGMVLCCVFEKTKCDSVRIHPWDFTALCS